MIVAIATAEVSAAAGVAAPERVRLKKIRASQPAERNIRFPE
jgi:hypothetical protein